MAKPPGKSSEKKANRSPQAKPADKSGPGSTKSILDRFHPIGAQYVRRTEASGITILLEVGIPDQSGNPVFHSVSKAELILQRSKSAENQQKGQKSKISSLPALTSWADEVEETLSHQSSGVVVPSSSASNQPKTKSLSGPSASKKQKAKQEPAKPDLEVRAVQRLGLKFDQVKLLPEEELAECKAIMLMTQKEYNFFRAQRAQDSPSPPSPKGSAGSPQSKTEVGTTKLSHATGKSTSLPTGPSPEGKPSPSGGESTPAIAGGSAGKSKTPLKSTAKPFVPGAPKGS